MTQHPEYQGNATGTTGSLDVVSCGIGMPTTERLQHLAALCDDAAHIYGSRTLLALCPHPERHHVIAAQAQQQAEEALDAFQRGERVVVLTSGDSLYNGFGGTLAASMQRRGMIASPAPATTATSKDDTSAPSKPSPVPAVHAGRPLQETITAQPIAVHPANTVPSENLPHPANTVPSAITFHPAITAFQALFHRLGMPWQEARLFSAHHSLPNLHEVLAAPLSVVYGGSRATTQSLAQALIRLHPASAERQGLVAERLGSPQERILRGTLAELAAQPTHPTAMLLCLPDPDRPAPDLALGLPETHYCRENNLITASDVRAVILARLRLPAWGVLWDMGAGSGSVGLEAAALRPQLQVVALEQHPQRIAMIADNQERLGVANHTVHLANAADPDLLDRLPAPDRVFIGGGGQDILSILDSCHARLRPQGRILVSAVTLETIHALYTWQPAYRADITTLDIAREAPIAGRYTQLKPQHRITLFTFTKETPEHAAS